MDNIEHGMTWAIHDGMTQDDAIAFLTFTIDTYVVQDDGTYDWTQLPDWRRACDVWTDHRAHGGTIAEANYRVQHGR